MSSEAFAYRTPNVDPRRAPVRLDTALACSHARPKYPFEPKSNAHLRPGQFWGVPLSNGRWTCGRVLSMKTEADDYFPGNSQLFLAALMSWHGTVMIYEGATPLRSGL